MNYSMLNTGNSTYVIAQNINVITNFDSVRMKKEIARLRAGEENSKLIDATKHKAAKSVVIMENGVLVLSSLSPETLVKRLAELAGGEHE